MRVVENVAENPPSALKERLLRELLAEEEFLMMVEEAKKTAHIGMFGKGKAEDFFKAKLEVYEG
ncbi:hypothetical protein [Thermococcus sp. 21S7]|uniref:hypothetical protein n=1 Tax=Thermococcus sp. 21S7 TaxID=1638221 RepID=UPI0014399FD9|nr:hypothetical protein [Thermococcus sp. 21S7]NJE61051.1 hypothetical protein [Thermococcus sp. 21S7]